MYKTLILASGSPRRKEILGYFSYPFTVIPSQFDEDSAPFKGSVKEHAMLLAHEKAKDVFVQHPNAIVIGCDTIVSLDDEPLGKPKNSSDSLHMLTKLAGRYHSVFSGISVHAPNGIFDGVEETKVLFNRATPDELKQYSKNLHVLDKAGSYAIQKAGSLLVNKIDGCYYNVCGFPINTLRDCLQKAGIDLWDYIKE